MLLFQDSGLQYKKFLAFPWILTVTWPVDTVSPFNILCLPLLLVLFASIFLLEFLPLLQDGGEYPLTQPCPYGRWFHSEFCDFVSVLVAQCQHSIILDGYMMNTVIALLTELSDSYVRAFRHTCTLAGGRATAKTQCTRRQANEWLLYFSYFLIWTSSAVKLLSALVGVAQSLGAGAENSQKLYDLQRAKTLRQKNTAQLKKMQKKITEVRPACCLWETKVTEIKLVWMKSAYYSKAAEEESRDREHDGRPLQRSFPEEILVRVSFDAAPKSLTRSDQWRFHVSVQWCASGNSLHLHGGVGFVDEALQFHFPHRQLPQICRLDDVWQGNQPVVLVTCQQNSPHSSVLICTLCFFFPFKIRHRTCVSSVC